jgi:hypothetical protein
MSAEQALLDWQKLHDWASAKPKGSEIGVACTNSRCPVANYLHERTQKLWGIGASIKAMDGAKERLNMIEGHLFPKQQKMVMLRNSCRQLFVNALNRFHPKPGLIEY